MLTVRTFRPEDVDRVHELFVRGQRDFAAGLEGEVEAYLRRSLEADLSDIDAHYLSDEGSHFWVAELDGRVVGMVGVQMLSSDEGELRRMSVASEARRKGIGRKLLETVVGFCEQAGYRRLTLSTVTQLQPAIALYLSAGFRLTRQESYGSMTVQFYVKNLGGPVSCPGDAQS